MKKVFDLRLKRSVTDNEAFNSYIYIYSIKTATDKRLCQTIYLLYLRNYLLTKKKELLIITYILILSKSYNRKPLTLFFCKLNH